MARGKKTPKTPTKNVTPKDAFRDEIAESTGEYAPAYIFDQPGNTIVGKLVRVSSGYSKMTGERYPILTIENEDTGEKETVHAFFTALRSQLAQTNPKVGERVAIKRLADRTNATGMVYHPFLVRVDRETQVQDFDYTQYVDDVAPATDEEDELPF